MALFENLYQQGNTIILVRMRTTVAPACAPHHPHPRREDCFRPSGQEVTDVREAGLSSVDMPSPPFKSTPLNRYCGQFGSALERAGRRFVRGTLHRAGPPSPLFLQVRILRLGGDWLTSVDLKGVAGRQFRLKPAKTRCWSQVRNKAL